MKTTFLLFFSLWMVSCSTVREKESLVQKYTEAVEDAKQAEPHEISDRLIAIKSDNKTLAWKKIGKDNYVKMITWTGWDGYDSQIGKEIVTSRETWGTAFPELKNFCTKLSSKSSADLSLRLEQLLGLPPKGDKTRVVEFWVKPTDMFRPSPDSEINDNVAELDFPKTATKEHREWINQLKNNSYGENGYPWTRLGYTYDWGSPASKVGLSEFVIQKNAKVYIDSVSKTEEYCK